MAITIKTPIDKSVLSAACDRTGMSDGAKQAFLGYFASVLKEYKDIEQGVVAPASSATTAPAAAETGSTPVTSTDKVVA